MLYCKDVNGKLVTLNYGTLEENLEILHDQEALVKMIDKSFKIIVGTAVLAVVK